MLRQETTRRLRNTFCYLAAWFPRSLVLVGVLTPSAGILGVLLWPILQRRLSLRVLIQYYSSSPPVSFRYTASSGYFFFRIHFGVIRLLALRGARWGLRVPAEMSVLAVYFGGLYGAFQSYARALYAEIIPPGEEARWYGLFSITEKVCVFAYPQGRWAVCRSGACNSLCRSLALSSSASG
jgi:UMF1 family MFS transporter